MVGRELRSIREERTVETNNSGLMSREKQNMPAILVRWDSSDIFHSLSSLFLFSHSIFLCYFYARIFRFSSLFLFYGFETKQYAILTREQRNQLNQIIRHCSSSFFYTISACTMCVYIYVFFFSFYLSFERDSLWTLITRDKVINFTFFFSSFIWIRIEEE